MKRPLAFVGVLAAAFVLLSPTLATAQVEDQEHIQNYDVQIQIERSGELLITETIDYDFGSTEHHGIFRTIPQRFRYDDRYDRVYPIHVVSVQGSPGTPAGYELSHDGGELEIKIGDPDKTISGEHTYTIEYSVDGALNGFSDHDELYWNAIGTEWSAWIAHATVTVTAPADIVKVACYAGEEGSGLSCSESSVDGSTATFRQLQDEPLPWALGPFDGLTVVVAIPRGVVPAPEPILDERFSFARAFALTPVTGSVAAALLLLVLAGVVTLVWRYGRDRRAIGSDVDVIYATSSEGDERVPLMHRGAIAVEYSPPEDIRPGEMGTLIDETANPLDVTATIVDLAVRGYLRIEEVPKKGLFGHTDWRLVQLKDPDDQLLAYERILFEGLFEDADVADIADLLAADVTKPAADLTKGSVLLSSLKTKFVARLNKVQEALYDDAVQRKWFARRPDKVRSTWALWAILLLVGAIGITVFLALFTHLALIGVPLVIGALALLAGAHWMPARTARGTGMKLRVLGFREYIATAEAQEARWQERENIFAKYLPYAVVFGLTEKWAKAFAGLNDELPSTGGWYVGTHPFTAGAFASSIGHFSVVSAGTIASTPSSSGSSGFGGGGGSGGGGGGGGGGSW